MNLAVFLCNNCLRTFGGRGDKWCVWCKSYDFFQIDELVAPSVATLNKKGYKTLASCSGHIFYSPGYIWFKDKYIFPTIPSGFSLSEFEGSSHLKWMTHNEEEIRQERIVLILETMNKLHNWILTLP